MGTRPAMRRLNAWNYSILIAESFVCYSAAIPKCTRTINNFKLVVFRLLFEHHMSLSVLPELQDPIGSPGSV